VPDANNFKARQEFEFHRRRGHLFGEKHVLALNFEYAMARAPSFSTPIPSGSGAACPVRCRIESFKDSHLAELFAIESHSFGEDSYRKEFFHRLCIDNRDLLLVARTGNCLLGYVMGEWHQGAAEVISLAVRPEFRGHGLGRKLLQRLLARIARARVSRVFLMVRANNQVALNLYRSLGFRRLRRVETYYSDGQDAIRMRLDLPQSG